MSRDKLFLIDGNSFCYRAYYAIKALSTSRGSPTNAIYGFIMMLRKIITEERPKYLAVAFDVKGQTFRHKMFHAYKTQRRPMPEDLIQQLPVIKEIIKAYNIEIFEKEGYEADDILATVVEKLKDKDIEIYLVTADKDTLQLVDERVKVYNPYSKEATLYNRKEVEEKFGVSPQRIPDILALVGDEADNIPGIKGIGEKTAQRLLQQFHSLDKLLENLAEVKLPQLHQTLTENQEQLKLNKTLVTLDKDVPVKVTLEDLRLKEPCRDKLCRYFQELEFKGLLKELIQEGKTEFHSDVKEIRQRAEWNAAVEKIKKEKIWAFQFQTTIDAEGLEKIVGLGIYYVKDIPGFIPLSGDSQISLKDLSEIFTDADTLKVCHDLKKKKLILDRENLTIGDNSFDVMLAAYLVNPSRKNYSLEDIALVYLDNPLGLSFLQAKESSGMCCEEAEIIFRLHTVLSRELQKKELWQLYKEVELPLVEILFSMEKRGVYLDTDFLKKMSGELNARLDNLMQEVLKTAGRPFNLDSPKQLREILFTELKLAVIKRGKTGPSTDEEVLTKLSPQHKLPGLILEYRELAKLKSTYIDALPSLVNPKTTRLHTNFNQVGTETGRLSSNAPNLQNIPVKTEFGRQVRKAISVKGKDCLLLSADYSQIELRILAHLSEDETLISAFNNNLDIHTHTAALIFSVPEGQIDTQQRGMAKTVNFGIIYGMSPFGLAKELNIEVERAEEFIQSYFARYPKVKDYIESRIKEARQKGYVTTIFNRRRFIPEINSFQQGIRFFAERTAINTPVQGSAADIIKLAMIDIHKEIQRQGLEAYLILQIHDELLFEFSKDYLDNLIEIVRNEMENVVKLNVPLKASLKVGRDWLEMKAV
jgi:DNA polymerase-1